MIHEIFGKKKIDKNLICDYLEQGWYKGATFKYVPQIDASLKAEKAKAEKVKKSRIKTDVQQLQVLHDLYIAHGFNKMVELTGYKFSKPNLVQSFRLHIKGFLPQNGKKRG